MEIENIRGYAESPRRDPFILSLSAAKINPLRLSPYPRVETGHKAGLCLDRTPLYYPEPMALNSRTKMRKLVIQVLTRQALPTCIYYVGHHKYLSIAPTFSKEHTPLPGE
jgi:hypothetical protein